MSFRHFLLASLLTLSAAANAAPVQSEHVEAELIAENQSFRPGEFDNWVALRLAPEKGWHVYWQNPGDSGIPTQLEWQLPVGVNAGPMEWPYPHRESLGDLTNYGYAEETLHLVPLRISGGSGGELRLGAKAKWLVCKDVCIPGEAQLSLTVPVADALPLADPAWTEAFSSARAQLPRAAPDWEARYALDGGDFSLAVDGARFAADALVEFFPVANDLVAHASEQRIALDDINGLRLSQKLSPYFVAAPAALTGVLVVHDGGSAKAFRIDAQPGAVAAVPAPAMAEVRAVADAPADDSAPSSLLLMLAFAFIGGLILNLMPCVFPVLAMKALSVMHSSGESAATNRSHALAYTAGVLASFLLVAGLLIALRASGAVLGWGFQLQSPPFVFALIVAIFAMGLSLSGVAHFGASWMGAGQTLASRPGMAGSFFTGVLAVVVASPCTAPFMAPALGFALAQPAASALLVFAALGLGLAAPFLLMGFIPKFATLLPRPGAWMETFKQLLAFPMYLTAVWLLWVLGALTGRDGMALAACGLVLTGFAVWLHGRGARGPSRALAMIAMIGVIALGFHPSLRSLSATPAAQAHVAGVEPWSEARFEQLRGEGRSVFVDFTADWCLTCKVNERGALRSARVREAFARHDVVEMVGDWTRADPAITQVLQRYGRSGVPLYLVSKSGAEPSVLPQVLTPDAVAAAFE